MQSNSFEINTSQNVTIDYEIAGVGDRILAAILDNLIKVGYILFIIFCMVMLSLKGRQWYLIGVLSIPILLYSLLFEFFMQGQTPGKRIRKIKVIQLDGSQPTLGAYLIRWIFRIIDINLFSGVIAIITIALSNKGQRLGDILAQTTVIKIQDTFRLKDTLYEKLNSDYTPTYPEAKKLSSEEIELIKKVLNTKEYTDNFDMVYTLANKIQAKMGVQRSQEHQAFLQTVVKDYNFLIDE